jgi:hypothetical protein
MSYDDKPSKGGVLPIVLPIVTSVVALAVGTLFGGLVIWLLKPSTIEEVLVPRNLTADELAAECAPLILEKTTELEAAEDKVSSLKSQVSDKEEKVAELEQEMKSRAVRGRALVMELEKAKSELRDVQEQLQVAQEEKNQLIEELKETVITLEKTEVKLVKQKELTNYAKEDALANKYQRFIGESQLEVCEKGNRKKLGACREAVTALMEAPSVRDRFAHCLRSGQASPSVAEAEKRQVDLPMFSEWMNQEDKIVKGWYINFCDPTLPENADGFLHEDHLPGAGTASTASAGSFLSDDEDDDFDFGTPSAGSEPLPEAGEPTEVKTEQEELDDIDALFKELEDLPD